MRARGEMAMLDHGLEAHDVLNRLLLLATQEPTRRPIANLVAAFGRQAHVYPSWGIWEPSEIRSRAEGSVLSSPESEPRLYKREEIAQLCEGAAVSLGRPQNFAGVQVRLATKRGPQWLLQLNSMSPDAGVGMTGLARGVLWLGLEPKHLEGSEDVLGSFRTDLSGWLALFRAFSALWSAAESAELSSVLTGSKLEHAETRQSRIVEAAALLGRIESLHLSSHQHRDVHEEIGKIVIQESFSSPFNWIDDNSSLLNSISDGLRRSTGELSPTVVALADCLTLSSRKTARLPDPPKVNSQTSPDVLAIRLMASCSGLLTTLRHGERNSDLPAIYDPAWQAFGEEIIAAISILLCHWSVGAGERKRAREEGHKTLKTRWEQGAMSTAFIPPWLCLWFSQELLRHDLEEGRQVDHDAGGTGTRDRRGTSASIVWRFRADLAFVIREAIRVFLFGKRPDYRFHPTSLSKALGTLVERHAVRIVGLPAQLDIRGLLGIIGRAQPFESEELSAGHLQHVFEVYITGHFLAKLRIPGASGRPTLAALMAGAQAGRQSLRETDLLRAFSLAALFHNVGRLLFPRWSPEIQQLGQLERGLAERLYGVAEALSLTAAGLAGHCRDELLLRGHLHPEEDKAILQWVDAQKARGHVDAAVLSAWFTHCATQGVAGLTPEVARRAVRAVVLHHAVTQPIRPNADPAASLLLICDELFAWNPEPAGAIANGGRRSIPFLSSSRPRKYRFESLELEGLFFERSEDGGELTGELGSGIGGSGKEGLPRFVITLAKPDSGYASTLMVWLGLAQSFQRVMPTPKIAEFDVGFAPAIFIRSPLPADFTNPAVSFRALLEEAASQAPLTIRPSLEEWLEQVQIVVEMVPHSNARMETILIRSLGKTLHKQDLRFYLQELEKVVELAVLRRSRPHSE